MSLPALLSASGNGPVSGLLTLIVPLGLLALVLVAWGFLVRRDRS